MSGTAVPVYQRHRRAAHYGTAVPVSQCTLQVHTHTRGYPVWDTACVGKVETGLDENPPACKNTYMSKRTGTMSELLRAALGESGESLNAIERATGIKRQSLATFLRGESTLRLDAADKLAAHFGIVCTRVVSTRRKAR